MCLFECRTSTQSTRFHTRSSRCWPMACKPHCCSIDCSCRNRWLCHIGCQYILDQKQELKSSWTRLIAYGRYYLGRKSMCNCQMCLHNCHFYMDCFGNSLSMLYMCFRSMATSRHTNTSRRGWCIRPRCSTARRHNTIWSEQVIKSRMLQYPASFTYVGLRVTRCTRKTNWTRAYETKLGVSTNGIVKTRVGKTVSDFDVTSWSCEADRASTAFKRTNKIKLCFDKN